LIERCDGKFCAKIEAARHESHSERKSMAEKPPVVLTIAGFDPCSGAGITADIKTIAAHGCYGVSAITALTVQSTTGVKRVEPSDPLLVTDTLEELRADVEIQAVRVGMLGSGKVARAVADFLSQAGPDRERLPNIVLGSDRPPDPAGRCGHPQYR
jgi:hydroxymethylpyrimidine/phosphomethylpyrimidine kinase